MIHIEVDLRRWHRLVILPHILDMFRVCSRRLVHKKSFKNSQKRADCKSVYRSSILLLASTIFPSLNYVSHRLTARAMRRGYGILYVLTVLSAKHGKLRLLTRLAVARRAVMWHLTRQITERKSLADDRFHSPPHHDG